MPQSPTEPMPITSFTVASIALAGLHTWPQVLELGEEVILTLFRPKAYALTWLIGNTQNTLFSSDPTLPQPNASVLRGLRAGRTVRRSGMVWLPLQILGDLRGWFTLRQPQRLGKASQAWTGQYATHLALLDRPENMPTNTRETAVLDKVGQLVRGTLSLPELLDNLATIVCDAVEAREFTIALLDDTTNMLTFAYARLDPPVVLAEHQWSPDEGLTGVVLRSGMPLNTPDYLRACQEHGIEPILPPGTQPSKAWLGVPLVHQERKLGVMVASTRSPRKRYTSADVHFMVMVAGQAAAAVANAQLYSQVERQAQQLRLINQIGRTISSTLDPRELPMLLAQAVSEVVEVEDVQVLVELPSGEFELRYDLADPTLNGLRVAAGAGLAAQALATNQILHADRTPESSWFDSVLDMAGQIESRCVLCAPLHNSKVRGVIKLRNKRGKHFNHADEALLGAIAEQAAIALGNAEEHNETDIALARQIQTLERRNDRLNQVVTLANALQSQENVPALTLEVARTVARLTDCERVMLALVDDERQRLIPSAISGFAIADNRYVHTTLSLRNVAELLNQAPTLGSCTYQVGAHSILPGFNDAVMLSITNRQESLIGVIVVDICDRAEPLSSSLIQTLEIVAHQTAIAINNVALASEQQQTVDRLTALNALSLAVNTAQLGVAELVQMTVSGAVGTTGGMGGGAIVINEDELQANHAFRLSEVIGTEIMPLLEHVDGLYTELRRDNLPASARAANIRRLLIVPMRGTTQTVGALWLGFAQSHITQAEREMAVLYAKMAGAVIENLHLFGVVRAARDRMASILASTREGILMVDAGGRVSHVNSAFGELLGLAETRLIGQSVEQLCGEYSVLGLDIETNQAIYIALKSVLNGNTEQFQGEFELKGAVFLNIAWTVLRAQANSGGSAGALLVAHDVTADRQMQKLRQDMSNMIVHDLRSPLTNMMISIDLLVKQLNGPINDDQMRILQIAAASCQDMLDMVSNLLDIGRLQTDNLPLNLAPVMLGPVVRQVIERLERLADDRHIHFVHTMDMAPPVMVDREMVRRILQNLMDNAVKFSPSYGEITITSRSVPHYGLPFAHAPGDWEVIEVRDHGSGIEESHKALIFEVFGQAPAGRGRGSGLGLAFCKFAIEAHGGSIWVESVVNQGSTFYLTLPIAEGDSGLPAGTERPPE